MTDGSATGFFQPVPIQTIGAPEQGPIPLRDQRSHRRQVAQRHFDRERSFLFLTGERIGLPDARSRSWGVSTTLHHVSSWRGGHHPRRPNVLRRRIGSATLSWMASLRAAKESSVRTKRL